MQKLAKELGLENLPVGVPKLQRQNAMRLSNIWKIQEKEKQEQQNQFETKTSIDSQTSSSESSSPIFDELPPIPSFKEFMENEYMNHSTLYDMNLQKLAMDTNFFTNCNVKQELCHNCDQYKRKYCPFCKACECCMKKANGKLEKIKSEDVADLLEL